MIPGIANSGYRPNANKPGVTWQATGTQAKLVETNASNLSLREKICTGDGRKWYLVGGTTIMERDGLDPSGTWNVVYTHGSTLSGLYYGGGYFIACNVGAVSSVLVWSGTSISGSPTTVSLPSAVGNTNGAGGIGYVPDSPTNKWVIGGISTNNAAYTNNPLGTWTNKAIATGSSAVYAPVVGLAGGNSRIVVPGGTSGLWIGSTNDIGTATLSTISPQPTTGSVRTVAYANGIWVVGTSVGEIVTSPWTTLGSPVWTVRANPFPSTASVRMIIYNAANNIWIAAAGNDNVTQAVTTAYSTNNGVTWSSLTTLDASTPGGAQGIFQYNNVIALGSFPTTTTAKIWYSI